jgi:hypothetical protein
VEEWTKKKKEYSRQKTGGQSNKDGNPQAVELEKQR